MIGSMPSGVLRERTPDQAPPVTSVELFFDLVYVFAVTQLSQHLLHHLTARGALETLVLFLAVWWAWNYTAWATNWIDPESPAVRVLLLALMLISLVMSAKIPKAFGDEAVGFATAYVAIQVVRSAFMVYALRGRRMARNYAQLLAWSFVAGVVLIASLWWVYFVRYAEEAALAISRSVDPTRMARAGYAYAHAIMVAGVIVVAVAIERTMVDPRGDTSAATAAVILGGPALYLAGNALFTWALAGQRPRSFLVGIVLLGALVPLAAVVGPLALSIAATLAVLALAVATGMPALRPPRQA